MVELNQLKMNLAARQNLGNQFAAQVGRVRSQRDGIMDKTWTKAMDAYEGKAPPRTFPWKNASNAIVPIIPTHVDAIKARLYNAATAQDPIHHLEPWGSSDVIPGVKVKDYAKAMNDLSEFIEREEVKTEDVYDRSLDIMTIYGDVIYFVDWNREERGDYDYNVDTGEFTKVENHVAADGAVIRIIHPEDFFIEVNAVGFEAIQNAKWCGYRFELDRATLLSWKKSGLYDKETAELLEGYFGPVEKKLEKRNYFPMGGDNPRRELDQKQDELLGLDESSASKHPKTLEMVHIFAREDFDGDMLEEEVNFHLHLQSGNVPFIARNHWGHKRRPLVRSNYRARARTFNSIGVPEMLFNTSDILTQVIRDILDNNKVQNTKAFLVRAGSSIPLDLEVYPSRVIYTEDIQNDFMPVDMGSGKMITSMQDLIFLMEWGERRTGITDFNLGQERTGRTPATTTLALLEEAQKRIDGTIRRMRRAEREIWYQVMSLYVQFGNPRRYEHVLGEQGAEMLANVWANAPLRTLMSRTTIRARISSQNLNRQIRREESMAMFGQAEQYYGRLLELYQLWVATQDPAGKELLASMMRGGRQIMQHFWDSYDFQDQDDVNPDVERITQEASIGLPAIQGSQTGGSNQVQAAMREVAAGGGPGGPINPPNRPEPGFTRPS